MTDKSFHKNTPFLSENIIFTKKYCFYNVLFPLTLSTGPNRDWSNIGPKSPILMWTSCETWRPSHRVNTKKIIQLLIFERKMS